MHTENKLHAVSSNRWLIGRDFKNYQIFFVHGFPVSKNKQARAMKDGVKVGIKFNSSASAHAGKLIEEFSEWDEYSKSPNINFAMSYGEEKDINGNIVKPPNPRGMSGGGLWVIPDLHKPENFYLAGIFIEYYKNKKLSFSTRLEQVVELIQNASRLG